MRGTVSWQSLTWHGPKHEQVIWHQTRNKVPRVCQGSCSISCMIRAMCHVLQHRAQARDDFLARLGRVLALTAACGWCRWMTKVCSTRTPVSLPSPSECTVARSDCADWVALVWGMPHSTVCICLVRWQAHCAVIPDMACRPGALLLSLSMHAVPAHWLRICTCALVPITSRGAAVRVLSLTSCIHSKCVGQHSKQLYKQTW